MRNVKMLPKGSENSMQQGQIHIGYLEDRNINYLVLGKQIHSVNKYPGGSF